LLWPLIMQALPASTLCATNLYRECKFWCNWRQIFNGHVSQSFYFLKNNPLYPNNKETA
jgi:hypothetical protein